MPSPNTTLSNSRQLLKVELPKLVTVFGMTMLFSPLLENALCPIDWRPALSVTDSRLEQLLNAESPIDVTPDGIVTDSIEEQ
jgi:hypothetical protein